MNADCRYAVHFGGPDLQSMRLRDVLEKHVADVPAGGEIDWVTYYFRDRRLAQALLDARRRGVRVSLTLEQFPRTPHANHAVVNMLSGSAGLGESLRLVRHAPLIVRPYVHEKLYCFSHPGPTALIGSFNPSGDEPELEPDIIREIRDQNCGHNALVAIHDPTIVSGLVAHARNLHSSGHGVFERFTAEAAARVRSDDMDIFFLPCSRTNPFFTLLRQVTAGAVVRIAASHIKGPTAVRTLLDLARRGVGLTILTEETRRRVPDTVEKRLKGAGISIRRFEHPSGLPMHNKFTLIEQDGKRRVVFGSFNWTERSFRFNHEIGAICSNADVVEAFTRRWDEIEAQAGHWARSAS
jgi:hypothetical protein